MGRLSRAVAVRMLLFHKVPAVRRLAKNDALALLRVFYACRTIQRWVRRTLVLAPHAARVCKRPQRDTSTLDAMRHILAATVQAALDDAENSAQYAADVRRLTRAMFRFSTDAARAACDACIGHIHKHRRHAEMGPVLNALQLALVCGKARPVCLKFYRAR